MSPFPALSRLRPTRSALRILAGLCLGLALNPLQAAPKPPAEFLDREQQCQPQPLPATVLHLSGEAWKLDARGGEIKLVEGMPLEEGEGVRTAHNAFVSLLLGDGSRIVLPSSSAIRLHVEKTLTIPQVILEQGQVESYVIKRRSAQDRLQIRTALGILGVRGTHFRTSSDTDGARLEVLDGQVVVTRADLAAPARKPRAAVPDETVAVGARQGLKIRPEGKLAPVDLLPAPRLAGQDGQRGTAALWRLLLDPLPGAQRYRAQVANDRQFLKIRQESFSDTPQLTFSDLPGAYYHVRLSAFDDQGLEGESAIYDILYLPGTVHAQLP